MLRARNHSESMNFYFVQFNSSNHLNSISKNLNNGFVGTNPQSIIRQLMYLKGDR